MQHSYRRAIFFCSFAKQKSNGGLAHQVERQVRNLKVAGSSPVSSTSLQKHRISGIQKQVKPKRQASEILNP